MIVRHDRYPWPPDDVEDRQIGRAVKYLDLRAPRLAHCLLDSPRVLDGPGHDFTYGLSGCAFSYGSAAISLEPIQIKHRHALLLCPQRSLTWVFMTPNAGSQPRGPRARVGCCGLSGRAPVECKGSPAFTWK